MREEKIIGKAIEEVIGDKIMIGERKEIEKTKMTGEPIRSYRDLRVYQMSYTASIEVLIKFLPLLPKEEKYDLVDQLRRSSKAVPRLIAEGYAKRHQHRGFHKYIDDSMGEANETSVSLSQCRDAYSKYVDKEMCDRLIDTYDRIGRQLYRLRERWRSFGG
ncbi:MAG: four helix bundle protein [Actinobacteria bacterium]|nr:four helix bundle protein [Actinomycetota bacterium]